MQEDSDAEISDCQAAIVDRKFGKELHVFALLNYPSVKVLMPDGKQPQDAGFFDPAEILDEAEALGFGQSDQDFCELDAEGCSEIQTIVGFIVMRLLERGYHVRVFPGVVCHTCRRTHYGT